MALTKGQENVHFIPVVRNHDSSHFDLLVLSMIHSRLKQDSSYLKAQNYGKERKTTDDRRPRGAQLPFQRTFFTGTWW
jgi:hypothetical protein